MRIKDFQKFHIGSDQGDQVALVPALKPGRTKPPQRPKDPVTDDGEQCEGYIVIGPLFAEFEHCAKNRNDNEQDPHSCDRKRRSDPKSMQYSKSSQDRDKLCAQKSKRTHQDRKQHKAVERLYKFHHTEKDPGFTLFFHHVRASFP